MIETPQVDWFALSPTLALLAASGVALLGSVLVPRWLSRGLAAFVTFGGFVAAGVLAVLLFEDTPEPEELLVQSMTRDRLGALAAVILAGAGALAVLVSWGEKRRDHQGEYYALLAAAGAGMVFFVSASNLMTLFLGLEWFSISLYILCALDTHRETSLEAGLKYLVVGSFGSAILLFGSALVYGATGELGFSAIADAPIDDEYLLLAGLALIIAGLGFKASAAPFHMWTPDVYQGAPTSVTAFMSAATKVAALVLTLRILVAAFPNQDHLWTIAIAVIAVVSLAVGNLAALVQRDLKRLLAYSSVSHAGFMLIAISVDTELGARALLYYLIPVLGDVDRSVRRRRCPRARARNARHARDAERLRLGAAVPRRLDVDLHARLHGPAADGRLRRQALRLLRGLRGGLVVARARGCRGDGDLALLLPERRARDVHAHGPELQPAVAGGSPPFDPLLATAVAASVAVTIGSFFFVQPLIEVARDAAASLPF